MKPSTVNQIPPEHQKMERSSDSGGDLGKAPERVGKACPSASFVSLVNADFSALSVATTDAVAMYFPKLGSSNTDARRFSRIQTEQGNTYELMNTLMPEDTQLLLSQQEMVWQGKTTIAQGAFGKVRFARNVDTNEIVAVKKMASVLGKNGQVVDNRARAEHEIKQMRLIQSSVVQQKAWSMMNQFAILQDHAHIMRPVKGLDSSIGVASSRRLGNKSYIFSEYASLGDGLAFVDRVKELRSKDNGDQAQQLLRHGVLSYTKAVRDLHRLGFHHRDIKPDNFLHYAALESTELELIKLTDFGFTHHQKHQTKWAGETSMYAPPESQKIHQSTEYDALAHDSFSLGLSLLVLNTQKYPCYAPYSPHLHLKTMDGQIKRLTLTFYRNLGESASERVRCMGVGAEHLTNLDMNHFDNIIAQLIATNKAERITAERAYVLFSQLWAENS